MAFFFFAFSLFLPLSVHAASYSVTTTDDEADVSPSCVTGASTDCSLREAVIAANANSGSDTIIVPAGTFQYSIFGSGEELAATGDIDITDTSGELTITGAGSGVTTVYVGGYERSFDVRAGASAVISGVEITGGSVSGAGGQGAGIRSVGAALTLNNVLIDNNGFSSTSAPAYSKGTGVYCSAGTLTITDSTIRNNGDTAEDIDGGGVYIETDCAADVDTVDIDANAGGQRGGGIYIATHATLEKTLNNVNVTDNTGNNGGGIFVISDVPGDTPVDIRNTTISGNLAMGQGGGIEFAGAGNMTNATITQNNARSNAGGVFIYNDNTTNGTIAFSTITNNRSNSDSSGGGDGGGIFVGGTSSDFEIRTSLVGSNTATSSNGPDCYAASDTGLTSGGYNYFSTMNGCSVTTVGTDDITTGPVSIVSTAQPEDNGGDVPTLRLWATDLNVDVVPVEQCLDAAGVALTRDARGASRPQGATCDFGAYEKDQTDPTVTPNTGDDAVECSVETWTNAGATVSDNVSTGLTAESTGSVSASTLGAYPITYTSEVDVDGNSGTAVRTVNVVDTTAPTITQTSAGNLSVTQGQAYNDPGATATDACDSSVSVDTTNPVDTGVPGAYTVTYRAIDDSGNIRTATRTVTVTAAITQVPEVEVGTAVDHGKITKLTQINNQLKITYADATTETMTPYGSSENFRAALSTNKRRIVVTNGKDIRVFVNGERVSKKIISTKTLSRTNYRVAVRKVYNGYDSVFIATAQKNIARAYAMRLTTENALTKQRSTRFAITNLSSPTLSVNSNKKQVTVAYGKSDQRVKRVWKLKSNGDFSLLQ